MRRHAESAGRAERMLGAIIVAQALTLAVSGPTSSPGYLPLRVAEAEGHFAKEGLVVTLKTTRAEPGAAEALAQGQADLVATSLEAMLRFGPRTPKQAPRLVLGLTAAPPVALVVAESQKELVRSLEDLPGTRVGVTAPGDDFEARLAGCRDLYLADGAVTVEQVRETLTVIRAHLPLPVTARVPPPEELLHVSWRVLTPPAAVR